jgi:hypothetical protein
MNSGKAYEIIGIATALIGLLLLYTGVDPMSVATTKSVGCVALVITGVMLITVGTIMSNTEEILSAVKKEQS